MLEDERYDRLLLELKNGTQFALNQTNTAILIKAWGHDTDAWIELELELALGTYKDWSDDPPTEKPTVRVRAISPAPAGANNGGGGESRCRRAEWSRRPKIWTTKFHFRF